MFLCFASLCFVLLCFVLLCFVLFCFVLFFLFHKNEIWGQPPSLFFPSFRHTYSKAPIILIILEGCLVDYKSFNRIAWACRMIISFQILISPTWSRTEITNPVWKAKPSSDLPSGSQDDGFFRKIGESCCFKLRDPACPKTMLICFVESNDRPRSPLGDSVEVILDNSCKPNDISTNHFLSWRRIMQSLKRWRFEPF